MHQGAPLRSRRSIAALAIAAPTLALTADAQLPIVVGVGAFALAAVLAYAHVPEDKSRGEQAPLAFVAVVALVLLSGLLGNAPLPRASGALNVLPDAQDALNALAEPLLCVLIGVCVGWPVGGLLPGSGWHRAGRAWKKGG